MPFMDHGFKLGSGDCTDSASRGEKAGQHVGRCLLVADAFRRSQASNGAVVLRDLECLAHSGTVEHRAQPSRGITGSNGLYSKTGR